MVTLQQDKTSGKLSRNKEGKVLIKVEGRKLPWRKTINSPIEETEVRFHHGGNTFIRVQHHKDALKVLRLKALKKWKKKHSVNTIEGYFSNTITSATLQIPEAWKGDVVLKERIITILVALFDGTHKDKYKEE